MTNQLQILSNVYTVEYNEDVYRVHNSFGLHFGDLQKIYVYSEMTPEKQITILTHEVIHALDEALQLGLTEQQVSALSEGLTLCAKIEFKWLDKNGN